MLDIQTATRTALFSPRRWHGRILLWIAACLVGGLAIAFAWLADTAHVLLQRLVESGAYWGWILPPAGLSLVVWLTRRYFPGAEGSGIPQTIYALKPDSKSEEMGLMKLHVIFGRMALAGIAIFSGASIGREGPTVHVGAGVAHAFARWMPHGELPAPRRALILAGGAAGVAAAFNTPLAGIVFAIEELSRSFEERASGATLTAVILAGVVVIALRGNYTYFGEPQISATAYAVTAATVALAVLTGAAGGLFSRFTLYASRGLPGLIGRLQRQAPVRFALLCGVGVAILGIVTHGLTFGTGYDEARSVLEANTQLPWIYAPARALATLLSYLSGAPAGLMAPSLSVGAGLGQLFSDALGHGIRADFAILGMCGYLAGVTQAPLTSFIIVMEMTTSHEILVPLMLTAAIATAISKVFSPPLYRALADRYGT